MPAYYSRTVREFLEASASEVVGELTRGNARFGFPQLELAQSEAWDEEITVLRAQFSELCTALAAASEWGILLEFPIPRRQQRIDVVLLARDLVFILEFKSGISGASWSSGRQAEDYALDLSYFHAPSHQRIIIPILVAPGVQTQATKRTGSNVRSLARVAPHQLGSFLMATFTTESEGRAQIALTEWDEGLYEPVPTVIEAAMALYSGMSVREITRSHAGVHNLSHTTEFVLAAIAQAQKNNQKLICFITGIPGAGKTLAGLNLVHDPDIHGDGRPASVFMSGNGPLVEILREALAVDYARRTAATKTRARSEVRTFVQNIHHFVKDNLERPEGQPPYEHAIVFDEAQRAWNAERNRKKYGKRSSSWHISEPEMVLKIMDRHKYWAVVIALVGGGQEIHEGEAGLAEWGKALQTKFPHWRVLASPEAIDGGESVAGAALFNSQPHSNHVIRESALHLDTCIRSHQARDLATWVNRVLEGHATQAAELSRKFDRFPVLLARDLKQMKEWLLENTRGERRCGLTASSGAARLRAHGIETSMAIREAYSYPHWFLALRGDVRSSYQLEVVATEFEIQGLELDFVGLCWGGDFIWDRLARRWRPFQFNGQKWKDVKSGHRATRIQNKYRVLMTRAREGLVIWVPEGDESDPTRSVQAMNDTADYLLSCGVVPMENRPLSLTT